MRHHSPSTRCKDIEVNKTSTHSGSEVQHSLIKMSDHAAYEYKYEYQAKRALEECLDKIQSVGTFALFESLRSGVPNPGLMIGHTEIGLPLSNNGAQTLISASHPAPFGKGTETIVDLKVRKTWELSAGEFRIPNPEWEKVLMKRVLFPCVYKQWEVEYQK